MTTHYVLCVQSMSSFLLEITVRKQAEMKFEKQNTEK